MIEVIMATYNGEKYVLEQIKSIFDQSVVPDYVSIYDDCSTDNTVKIIKDFIYDNHLENWNIIVNESNVGWKNNFMNGLKKSHGDIVFLCDQDDVWVNEKIETMYNVLNDHSEIEVLVSDYEDFYENKAQKISIRKIKSNKTVSKIPFTIHFNEIFRPGCTMAFKKHIISDTLMLYEDGMAHDQAVWITGILRDGLYYLDKKLIKYRRHENNASPVSGHTKESRLSELRFNYAFALAIINKKRDLLFDEEKARIIRKYAAFCKKRIIAIKEGNIIRLVLLLSSIFDYPKFTSWLGDGYVMIRGDN